MILRLVFKLFTEEHMCVYVCICVCRCVCIQVCLYMCRWVYVCGVCVDTYMCVYMCAGVFVCVGVYIFVCVCWESHSAGGRP